MNNVTLESALNQLPTPLECMAATGLHHVFEPVDSEGLIVILASSALAVAPIKTEQEYRAAFTAAVEEAMVKHIDFCSYLEPMAIVSLGLLPYTHRISAAELVEVIYCAAKHADFLQPARRRSVSFAQDLKGAQKQ